MDAQPLATWQGRSADEWRREWRTGELRFFETIGSTNDVVSQMAAAGAPHLSIAVADEQTRGRGRGGATWSAPRGSALLFSVLFRVREPGGSPGCAPIRVGIAVAEAVSMLCGHDALVKWPNDVVFPGAGKVAGVLCEGSFTATGQANIIAGIGVNVLQKDTDFDVALRGSACSIASATAAVVDRAELLGLMVDHLHEFGDRITEPLTDDELARFRRRDVLRDAEVLCDLGAPGRISGIARGVAEDGALLVEHEGNVLPVYNATVRLAQTHAYPGSGREL